MNHFLILQFASIQAFIIGIQLGAMWKPGARAVWSLVAVSTALALLTAYLAYTPSLPADRTTVPGTTIKPLPLEQPYRPGQRL